MGTEVKVGDTLEMVKDHKGKQEKRNKLLLYLIQVNEKETVFRGWEVGAQPASKVPTTQTWRAELESLAPPQKARHTVCLSPQL